MTIGTHAWGRTGRRLLTGAALAGCTAMGASQANATFLIQTSADGATWDTFYSNATDGTIYSGSGVADNGLEITALSISSNSPGSSTRRSRRAAPSQ